ncbi:branched-chain amino acid ABC transporter ATP-binding protein/permease [Trinickia violacea]|uniref:Branched-chain amino acid ABC transporter ATP-binding protein/permease n=1 Tax=Trinickia violacea TaxID=2571746 RepID=A0A4P8IZY8_9BURK|nr:branched-chain amino acid ABC transporter ATP-binding protein/permease [Trinickia violacea]QCP55008.1 branched-chain amino acid ABC transporter ATP-binding protein/permease [Trinickia violacea]
MDCIRKLPVAALVIVLAAFPWLVQNPYYVHQLTVIGIYAILLFGLDIVVGYTGEISLGHAGLFGVGAYSTGLLLAKAGLPFWTVLPASMAITAFIGSLLAVPALRVTGPYLAMVTLAFGTIVGILLNEMDFLTNGPEGLQVLKPVVFGHQVTGVDFYYFTLIVVALTLVGVSRLLESHIGRAFVALRGSPVASNCMGVSVLRFKVLAFVASAALAGLAGGMYAFSEEYIAPNTFNFELATLFLLGITLGGRRTRSGAIVGAAVVVGLPGLLSDVTLFRDITIVIAATVALYSTSALARGKIKAKQLAVPFVAVGAFLVFAFTLNDISQQRLTIFGLLILGVVYYLPDGIMGYVLQAMGGRRRATPSVKTAESLSGVRHAFRPVRKRTAGQPLLEAKGIVMQFGGLKALDGLDLDVASGIVHGLIGPNGSGKSTMMNVLSGVYAPSAGTVRFHGDAIAGRHPSAIALAGIARTFQNVQLFGDMTSVENVLVGLHHTFRSSLLDVVFNTRRYRVEAREAQQHAVALLEFVGLHDVARESASNLPYGRMRLLEIARALALGPDLLLLDEPAAGVPPAALPDLVAIIRKIREHGISVVLIEHHMDVVMSICDRVTVMDFGHKIAEGDGAEVRRDPKVIAAYLGSEGMQETSRDASSATHTQEGEAPVGNVRREASC